MFQKWFTIKKGRHFSLHGVMPQWPNKELVYEFMLTEDCWYGRNDLNKTTGVNKIIGRSMGLNHKKNSVRIGWQPVFNKKLDFHLYIYIHENGKKYQYDVARIKADIRYVVRFRFADGGIYADMGEIDNRVYTDIGFYDHNFKPKVGWKLFPYFGGDSHAPWDMKLFAKKN